MGGCAREAWSGVVQEDARMLERFRLLVDTVVKSAGRLLACLLASSLARWLSCAFWCCRCGVGLHAHMSPCFLHTPNGNYRPALPGDGMKVGCR